MNNNCGSILLVEDDRDIREVVRDILESEGYPVKTAANGREALEHLRHSKPPCLIFLDLNMPVMSGGEFLEVGRKEHVIEGLPVVVVSATPEKAFGKGATQILRKPPDLERLLSLAARHCHRDHAHEVNGFNYAA